MLLWLVSAALASDADGSDLCGVLLGGGSLDRVRATLDAGADPNATCRWKESVPAYQTFGGLVVGVLLPLVSWPFLGERVSKKRSAAPLRLAMGNNDPEVAIALLDAGARPYEGALDDAVTHDRWGVAGRLVAAGALPVLTHLDLPLAGDLERLDRVLELGIRLDGVTEIGTGGRLLTDPLAAGAFLDAGLPAGLLVHEAAERGSAEVLDAALDRAVPTDPLVYDALEHAATSGRWDLVDRLGAHGVAWELPGHQPVLVSLVTAGSLRGVDRALRAGAPADTRSIDGQPLLHLAVAEGRSDILARLLEADAPADATDGEGYTAMARAAERGRTDLVRALLDAGADPDRGRPTPLAVALDAERYSTASVLLSAGATLGNPHMTELVDGSRTATLRYLLQRGLDPDRRLADGQTLTAVAARAGKIEVLATLASSGADLRGTARGSSALLAAIEGGSHDAVEWLVARGIGAESLPADADPWASADVRMERILAGRLGLIPPPARLYLAVEEQDADRVAFLLEHGADPDGGVGPTADRLAPVEVSRSDRIEALLFAAGARIPDRMVGRLVAQRDWSHLERLRIVGARLDPHWEEVLDAEGAEWMLAHGASLSAVDQEGRRPLALAARRGVSPVLAVLLAAGADPAARDGAGDTALHAAIEGRCVDCLARLLRAGADPNARTAQGQAPIEIAIAQRLDPAVDLLIEGGAIYTAGAIRSDAASCRVDRLARALPSSPEAPRRWRDLRPDAGEDCRREVRRLVRR